MFRVEGLGLRCDQGRLGFGVWGKGFGFIF